MLQAANRRAAVVAFGYAALLSSSHACRAITGLDDFVFAAASGAGGDVGAAGAGGGAGASVAEASSVSGSTASLVGSGGAGAGGSGGVGGEGSGGSGGQGVPICGDGMINVDGEECDDMNLNLADGCSMCQVTCPAGWQEEPTTHHCFRWTARQFTFNEAKNACGSSGAKLASLATQAEIDFVKDWQDEKTWIGGSHNGNAWVWENGEAMTMTMPPWASGEPSVGDGCAVIGNGASAGKFIGESCSFQGDYICESAPPGTGP